MTFNRAKLLLLPVFFIFLSLSGQENVLFRHIGTSDGLSNGSVKSIIQDKEGFIWIGTIGGLNKYDGSRFSVYNYSKADNQSISTDDISCILEDLNGRIWIGTFGGGINVYDKISDKFTHYRHDQKNPASISSNEINTITETSEGIWVGTEGGLSKFDEARNAFFPINNQSLKLPGSGGNSVRSVLHDKNNSIWIGTFGDGLKKLDISTGSMKNYRLNPSDRWSVSSDFILDLEPFLKDYLLIATDGGGINLFDKKEEKFYDFFKWMGVPSINSKIIKDVFTDSKGNVWIGTDGEGLFCIKVREDNSFYVERFQHSGQDRWSLASNAIYKIFEDRSQNIWIGTAWNGISIIEKGENEIRFLYSDFSGIDPSPVLSIYVDKKNGLWIGTDGKGVNYYKNGDRILDRNTTKLNYLNHSYIQFIHEDTKENIWMGTYSEGLFCLKRNGEISNFKSGASKNFISHNNVRSIIEDERGNFWIATWGGGLNYFDVENNEFRKYFNSENNPASLSNNNVLALEMADSGKIWVGTFGGGLNLFDPSTGKFSHYLHKEDDVNSISGNNITCLYNDSKNNLWIGTWGAGLTRFIYKTGIFERYTNDEGLQSSTVMSIEEDRTGILWISTKKGVFSMDPEKKNIKLLNQPGINQINDFHINSSAVDSSGKLFFGGLQGLISFHPSEVKKNYKNPTVKFTGFELFNKETGTGKGSPLKKHIAFTDVIQLNYKQNVFTFIFSVLDYPFSNDFEYSIKMEGFEKVWRNIGSQKSATYTNLAPGDYVFKIKAKYLNSEWDEEYSSLKVKITPPLWRTWWAYVIYIVFFGVIAYYVQRYTLLWLRLKNNLKVEIVKREQEAKLHQLKLRFFTNISHEIRTPLTLILNPLNKLISDGNVTPPVHKTLLLVRKNGERLLNLINELLDFRRIETGNMKINVAEGNIVKFTHEIFLSFSEYAINRKINYCFNSSNDEIRLWFDRTQLEKVIFNLLSNAFKFTPENGTITVDIYSHGGDFVDICVSDTGPGISKNEQKHLFERFYQSDAASKANESGYGIGLSLARELVELHSGIITVDSDEGLGAKFIVTLKKGRDHFNNEIVIRNYKNSDQIENYQVQNADVVQDNLLKGLDNDEFSGFHILIIEDNYELRDYLAGSLSEFYQVSEAENGKEGFDKAVEIIPELVISDIMMPVMDGITLTRKLKTDMRTSHIPVILLTARTSLVYKTEGYETGADEYLTKPFSNTELLVRIKNLLRNRKLLRERYLKEAMLQPRELILASPEEKFLDRLISVIEENIEETELKIELLAREVGMSHSVIYKKVKALTGQSVVEFVRDIKLKRAMQLLKQNKISISEVCYKVGFSDRRYFSESFKKKFGITPSEYAKDKEIKE